MHMSKCIDDINNCLALPFSRTKWVQLHGQRFKAGAAVVYNLGSDYTDFRIAVIQNVYIVNGKTVLFKAHLQKIKEYNHHFRVHTLATLPQHSFIPLPLYLPLHPRHCRVLPNDVLITLPFYIC